jgi:hypothetical protein
MAGDEGGIVTKALLKVPFTELGLDAIARRAEERIRKHPHAWPVTRVEHDVLDRVRCVHIPVSDVCLCPCTVDLYATCMCVAVCVLLLSGLNDVNLRPAMCATGVGYLSFQPLLASCAHT